MSLLNIGLSTGDLRGVIYTFEVVGDTLSYHTHGVNDAHITIVARGRMMMQLGIVVDGQFVVEETMELGEGKCIDTEPGVYHQFVSLTDDARIFNIIKRLASGTDTAR